jgi:hypothetical protein
MFRNVEGFDESQFVVKRADGSFSYQWNVPGDRATGLAFLQKTANGVCVKAAFTPLPQNAF